MWENVLKFGMLEKTHLYPSEVGDGDFKIKLTGSRRTWSENAKKEHEQGTLGTQKV